MDAFPIYLGHRNVGSRSKAAWGSERRTRYLLREDVDVPVSLDVGVTLERANADERADVVEMLAIAFVEGPGPQGLDWRGLCIEAEVPADDDPNWLTLGFDVCDYFGKSALMNCGLGEARAGIPAYWRLAVNAFHLFSRREDAVSFSTLADTLIPEHAPFVAIALRVRRPAPLEP